MPSRKQLKKVLPQGALGAFGFTASDKRGRDYIVAKTAGKKLPKLYRCKSCTNCFSCAAALSSHVLHKHKAEASIKPFSKRQRTAQASVHQLLRGTPMWIMKLECWARSLSKKRGFIDVSTSTSSKKKQKLTAVSASEERAGPTTR